VAADAVDIDRMGVVARKGVAGACGLEAPADEGGRPRLVGAAVQLGPADRGPVKADPRPIRFVGLVAGEVPTLVEAAGRAAEILPFAKRGFDQPALDRLSRRRE